MSKQQHPTHNPVPSQPGAEPYMGVENSVDQRDRDGSTQGIDQDVGDSLGAPRATHGGIETPPPKSEQI
jgi:hypothetical protein